MRADTKIALSRTAPPTIDAVTAAARAAEADGYRGVWSSESAHDPFLPLVLAAGATSHLEVGTAISVAFARNPVSLAYTAHDLQTLSAGRFVLGLGSQVKPHIERRFSSVWSSPAARMREFVGAMRAAWRCWDHGERLDFRGDFYTHTLMTPFFSPAPGPWGAPKVHLAAVGSRMTEVAGEVCDGLHPHSFTTERYLREHTLPTFLRGLEASGRSRSDVEIYLSGMVVSGRSEKEMAEAHRGVRDQIAFYASTPTYRAVLSAHGWDALGEELTALSRSDDPARWARMGELVPDEVIRAVAVVAEPAELGPAIRARYGDLVDRFGFYAPYEHTPDLWDDAVADLAAHDGRATGGRA